MGTLLADRAVQGVRGPAEVQGLGVRDAEAAVERLGDLDGSLVVCLPQEADDLREARRLQRFREVHRLVQQAFGRVDGGLAGGEVGQLRAVEVEGVQVRDAQQVVVQRWSAVRRVLGVAGSVAGEVRDAVEWELRQNPRAVGLGQGEWIGQESGQQLGLGGDGG